MALFRDLHFASGMWNEMSGFESRFVAICVTYLFAAHCLDVEVEVEVGPTSDKFVG